MNDRGQLLLFLPLVAAANHTNQRLPVPWERSEGSGLWAVREEKRKKVEKKSTPCSRQWAWGWGGEEVNQPQAGCSGWGQTDGSSPKRQNGKQMWPPLLPMHNWEPAGWWGTLHNKDNLVSKLSLEVIWMDLGTVDSFHFLFPTQGSTRLNFKCDPTACLGLLSALF